MTCHFPEPFVLCRLDQVWWVGRGYLSGQTGGCGEQGFQGQGTPTIKVDSQHVYMILQYFICSYRELPWVPSPLCRAPRLQLVWPQTGPQEEMQ